MVYSIFETLNGCRGLGLPAAKRLERLQSLELTSDVRDILIDEFLCKIMWNAVDSAFQALVTCCLSGLDEAFDFVLLTFGAFEQMSVGPRRNRNIILYAYRLESIEAWAFGCCDCHLRQCGQY